MTYVVVGAAGRLGGELAAALARAGHDLVIVSSDARDLDALAADITVRWPVRVVPVAADIAAEGGYLDRIAEAIGRLGPLEGMLFPLGVSDPADDATLPADAVERLIRVNLTTVICAVSRFLPELLTAHGVVVGFGSIAATRGRGANVVYAAAKRGLESFFESLRHRYAGAMRAQLYVLGFIESGRESRSRLPKGDPATLSARVVNDLGRDVGRAYYPGWWRYVAIALAWIPWHLFRRLRA